MENRCRFAIEVLQAVREAVGPGLPIEFRMSGAEQVDDGYDLADSFLPRKVMENREQEIIKCLHCFTCMAERAATSTRRCTVNPLIGREMEGDEVLPASVKKKVLKAGAGSGGLYAAYTAARRGHQVILCEKGAETGGILKSEQALPFKQEMYELLIHTSSSAVRWAWSCAI